MLFSVAFRRWIGDSGHRSGAQAVGTAYPFCIQGDQYPGLSNCTFTSYQQCQATASGTNNSCIANPYYDPGGNAGASPGRYPAPFGYPNLGEPKNRPGRSFVASYRPGNALRKPSSEIIMRPLNGWLSSRIKKIEAVADSEKMQRIAIALALLSANRLMLAKISVSQLISTIRKGVGIDPAPLVNRSRRVFPASLMASMALA